MCFFMPETIAPVNACRMHSLGVHLPAADAASHALQPQPAAASSPWSIPAQIPDPVTPTGLASRRRLLGASTSFNPPPSASQPQGFADDATSAAQPFSAARVSMGGNAQVSGAGSRGGLDSMQSPRTFLRPGSTAVTTQTYGGQGPAGTGASSRTVGQQRVQAAQSGGRSARAGSDGDSDDDNRSGRRNARGPGYVSLLDRSLAPVCQSVSSDLQVGQPLMSLGK